MQILRALLAAALILCAAAPASEAVPISYQLNFHLTSASTSSGTFTPGAPTRTFFTYDPATNLLSTIQVQWPSNAGVARWSLNGQFGNPQFNAVNPADMLSMLLAGGLWRAHVASTGDRYLRFAGYEYWDLQSQIGPGIGDMANGTFTVHLTPEGGSSTLALLALSGGALTLLRRRLAC
jgi:hypothetical protein